MAIALSSNELERTIGVLSSAAQTLQLTRFERLSYLALMLSADVATVSLIVSIPLSSLKLSYRDLSPAPIFVSASFTVFTLLFALSIFIGTVSLILTIPLFVKVMREQARLKTLGLSSLSKSLWIESRRRRWLSRARGCLLTGTGLLLLCFAVIFGMVWLFGKKEEGDLSFLMIFLAVFYGLIAGFVLTARYLRNLRERIDLTANANELRSALCKLYENVLATTTLYLFLPNS
jgi:hypothetical protein